MDDKQILGLDPAKFGITDDDVVEFGKFPLIKFSALMTQVLAWSSNISNNWPNPSSKWFDEEGFEFKILCAKGGGWQKIRVRFRLELIPENPEIFVNEASPLTIPESPLDDLRAKLNNE